MHVEKLRDVREIGAGTFGRPIGAGQRDLFAGVRRDGVQPQVRLRGRPNRVVRPGLVRGVRSVARRQAQPVLQHVDAQRATVGRHHGAVGTEAERGRGRRVCQLGYGAISSII